MARFRPCIDLHAGKVKQIVGATLAEARPDRLQVHFESDRSPAWFAGLYRRDGLRGGHVIMLGPGNERAAESALRAYPGGLQVGGGITARNARAWLARGADKVIVTSWVFREGRIAWDRLETLSEEIGPRRLVLDLSCRPRDRAYYVVTDRWQRFTAETIRGKLLERLAEFAAEFLVHAVDREGRQAGVDPELIRRLADASPLPCTYAGGIRNFADIETVVRLGRDRLDFTVGSALDIFGGRGVRYADLVRWNREHAIPAEPPNPGAAPDQGKNP